MWKLLKRWPALLGLLVAFGALVVGLICLPYHRGRVTRESCERIKVGMTEAEVRAILGKPWDHDSLLDPEGPSDHVAMKLRLEQMEQQVLDSVLPPQQPTRTYSYGRFWVGDDLALLVWFDSQSQAVFVKSSTDPNRPRSWLPARVWRRLRARYGW
jgi:hypothetical protein